MTRPDGCRAQVALTLPGNYIAEGLVTLQMKVFSFL